MAKYTAVIIEPREHKALAFVLRNFLENLSDDWKFVIFHGNRNKTFIENILQTDLKKFHHRIYRLIQLDVDNLTYDQYNAICKNPNFYKCIDTELLLIFQTDTIILNKEILNDFLEYDYVGAPWRNGVVGNGGLSLRRRDKMMEVCEKIPPSLIDHEDDYFSYQSVITLKKPLFQDAQRFSVETVFHKKSFGVHAPWKYLNEYDLGYLINRYPDLVKLIELNS
jgi:hypothetical protein